MVHGVPSVVFDTQQRIHPAVLAIAPPTNIIVKVVVFLVPMILSLSVHEFAHAWAAYRLGDDTAMREGRLTLNPLAHVDVFGTLIIPTLNVLMGGFAMIGWAKPTPVRPARFNRKVSMRNGMILTALAGPLSNLLLSIIAIGVSALLVRFAPNLLYVDRPTGVAKLLQAMFVLNVGLFVFNLLPLPPLDGSRLLPRSMDKYVSVAAPYSFVLLVVVINFPVLRDNLLVRPVMITVSILQWLFSTRLWGIG